MIRDRVTEVKSPEMSGDEANFLENPAPGLR
jgi:hypothetical protein